MFPTLTGACSWRFLLEREYPINVPDAAFEEVLRTFDRYRWHLDERPTGQPNEINPEVLGYILEQYINQKDMGAYYTYGLDSFEPFSRCISGPGTASGMTRG